MTEDYESTTRNLVARLEALVDVGRAVTATLDPAEVLSLIVNQGAKALGVHAAAIFTPDPHSGAAHIMNAHGLSADFLSDFVLTPGVGIAGAALREERPVWTEDVQADRRFPLPEGRRRRARAEGIRAVLAVPIPTPQRLRGVLVLYRRDPGPFLADQIRFASLFADQAAIAIENARLYQESQRRAREAAALAEVGQLLSASLEMDHVLAVIVDQVRRLMGVPFAGIMALDEERQDLTYVQGTGLSPEHLATVRLRVGEGIAGRAVAQRAPVQSANLPDDVRFVWPGDIGKPGFRSALCTPLLAGERPLGAIIVFRRDAHEFAPEESELLVRFAAQSAIAIQNARLYQDLKRSYDDLRRSQDILIRQEKMAAVGRLAAGLAHELNNPLAAVAGFAERLQEKARDPELAAIPAFADFPRYLKHIAEQGFRCGALVHRLLTFARQREIQRKPLDLWQAVEDCVALMAGKVRLLGGRFQAVRGAGNLTVVADASLLQQVALNLLINALDAVEGGGAVRVAAYRDDTPPGGPVVVLEVADTGIGIPPDALSKLFDPFFTTKGERGTGLGLPLCLSIVEQHEGTLGVASPGPGLGATATVRLPAAP